VFAHLEIKLFSSFSSSNCYLPKSAAVAVVVVPVHTATSRLYRQLQLLCNTIMFLSSAVETTHLLLRVFSLLSTNNCVPKFLTFAVTVPVHTATAAAYYHRQL